MNRTGARVLGGVVILEIIVIILLLIFRTCCPVEIDRLADASEGSVLVLFQPATDVGPNPFLDLPDRAKQGRTGSIAITTDPDPAVGQVGTYGGTTENTCDPELLKEFLTAINPAKGRAWAQAQGIDFGDIESFIDGLTSSVLLVDTYVTNYGYKNGLTSNPSVLAKGTAVLVDAAGEPVVRCMCGNPIKNRKQPPPPPPQFDCIIRRNGRLVVPEAETGYLTEGPSIGADAPVVVQKFTPTTIEDVAFATVLVPDGSIIDVSVGALQGDCLPDQTLCVSFGPADFIDASSGPPTGTLPVQTVVSTTGVVTALAGVGYVDATWMQPNGMTGGGKVDVSTSVDIALGIAQENPCLPIGDCTVAVESLATNPNDGNTVTLQAGSTVNVVSYDFTNGTTAYITNALAEGPIDVANLEGDCQALTTLQECVTDGPLPYIDPPAGQKVVNLGPNQVVTVTGGVRVSGSSQWIGVAWNDGTGDYTAFARSDGLFPLDDCVPDECSGNIEVNLTTDAGEATLVFETVAASQLTFANSYPFDFSLIDVDLADGRKGRVSIAEFVGLGCEFPGFGACTAVELYDVGGPLLITTDVPVIVTGWDPANSKYQVIDGNSVNALAAPPELKQAFECGSVEIVIETTTIPPTTVPSTTTATTAPPISQAPPTLPPAPPSTAAPTTAAPTTAATTTTTATTQPPRPACQLNGPAYRNPASDPNEIILTGNGAPYRFVVQGGPARDELTGRTMYLGTAPDFDRTGWVFADDLSGGCEGVG